MINRMANCVHESSHAVTCLALGGRVDAVSLGDNEVRHPYARVQYEHSRRGDLAFTLVTLSGYAGQWLYERGGDVAGVRAALAFAIKYDTSEDFRKHRERSAKLAATHRGPARYSRERISEEAVEKVLGVVQRNWPAILEIAEQLDRCGRLSGPVVEMLFEEATRDPASWLVC